VIHVGVWGNSEHVRLRRGDGRGYVKVSRKILYRSQGDHRSVNHHDTKRASLVSKTP